MSLPSDARLWALLVEEFRAAGADSSGAQQHARRAVAIARRERATTGARTFAPGEEIPDDVTRVYDLDGDVWDRSGTGPDSSLRDSWRMQKFDPDQHEPAAGGMWVTPFLLQEYGPLTELPTPRPR